MTREPGDRVLVVGLGFIGSHVAAALERAGVPTTILTRRSPSYGGPAPLVQIVQGDAADPATVARAMEGAGHVVYCAGGLMPAQSNLHPTADIELALPPLICILEALRQRPGAGVTFLSSGGTVYGNPLRLPVDEDHPTDPITSYGVMKLASEKYIRMYTSLYGVPGRILRCSNVYGEGQPPDRGQGVIAAFLHRALADQPITVFGDGSVVRDYLYAGDLADLVVRLLTLGPQPELANVGSGVGTSLRAIVDLVEAVSGRAVRVEHRPARAFDIAEIVLDVTRLRRLLPFDPVPVEVGIRRTWDALVASSARQGAVGPLGIVRPGAAAYPT
jgi:UDP-glucose 4-epimerase